MEKEYVIGLNRGVDTVKFWEDIEKITNLDNIPNRAVKIANPRPGSNRLTHYYLTEEEAEIIRQDLRVVVVEIPSDQNEDIKIGLHSNNPPSNFTRANNATGTYVGNIQNLIVTDASGSAKNWGLLRAKYLENPYTSSSTPTKWDLSGSFVDNINGTGVDIVIQDSGIQANHPEWEDANGNSRLQEINWYTASFMSGSQPAGFYTDYQGHGTHVAGIAAGKTFGFAKESRIYSQKLAGLEGSTDPNAGIPVADAFDTIRLWHINKSGSRPTVVNMSWGYSTEINAGYFSSTSPYETLWNWRGTTYYGMGPGAVNPKFGFGLATYLGTNSGIIDIPYRVSSVDIEVEEMIDAGITVVIASGNSNYKIDIPGGIDYDNYFQQRAPFPRGFNYYHRGSSPLSTEALMVGALDFEYYTTGSMTSYYSESQDRPSDYTCAGPGVEIYAAGSNIISAVSDTNAYGSSKTANYHEDPSFKQAILNGTSMASPQVAGLAALLYQLNPLTTPSQLKSTLIEKSGNNMVSGSSSGNVYDGNPYGYFVTKDGPNNVLYNFIGQENLPISISGPLSISANLIIN